MTVNDSVVTGNHATGASGWGGAILNDEGTLSVNRTVINANDSKRAGGGIEANIGTTNLSSVVLRDNTTGASPGNGGGLHLSGAGNVRIDRSVVFRNSAANQGGGLWNSSPGTMIVTGSSITQNTAPIGPNVYWMPPGTGTFTIDGSPVTPG